MLKKRYKRILNKILHKFDPEYVKHIGSFRKINSMGLNCVVQQLPSWSFLSKVLRYPFNYVCLFTYS